METLCQCVAHMWMVARGVAVGGFWETGAQVKARGKQGWTKP